MKGLLTVTSVILIILSHSNIRPDSVDYRTVNDSLSCYRASLVCSDNDRDNEGRGTDGWETEETEASMLDGKSYLTERKVCDDTVQNSFGFML